MSAPEKRPAFEPPAALVRGSVGDSPSDSAMKRPLSTIAGSALVLLRVAAGIVWMLSVAFGWDGWVVGYAGGLSGDTGDTAGVTPEVRGVGLTVFLIAGGVVFLVEATFGLLILRGRNLPRLVVMTFSVLSISTAFAGWWAQGQDIRFSTTLVTLSLDILVLLALSSRSAAAYAHRREQR